MPSIIKHLLQHRVDRVVKGVCAQDEPSVRIHEVQNHCGEQRLLHYPKRGRIPYSRPQETRALALRARMK